MFGRLPHTARRTPSAGGVEMEQTPPVTSTAMLLALADHYQYCHWAGNLFLMANKYATGQTYGSVAKTRRF